MSLGDESSHGPRFHVPDPRNTQALWTGTDVSERQITSRRQKLLTSQRKHATGIRKNFQVT